MDEEKSKLFEALDDVSSIFDEISNEWTNSCFDDNFSDFNSFANAAHFSILQALDYSMRLSELCSRLLFYAGKRSKSTEIWNVMAGRNFDAKKLCIFAWYLIERGQQPDVCIDDRKIGLLGTRIYVSLCCLNGAQAFKIFNDYLFQRALEQLRLVRRLVSTDVFSKISSRDGLSGRSKIRNRKPVDASNLGMEQIGYEQLTLEDRTELKEMLSDALDSIFVFLNKVSLSSSQQSLALFAILLQQLMQVDFSEKTSTLECSRLSDFQRLHSFSDRSFALMHRFLDGRHASCRVVYGRIVMPRLLYWTFENAVLPASAHPPKMMTTYKDAMLRFMKMRVEKGSEEEASTVLLILQNICFRCPDRSDYRTKVASCVIEVLVHLPHKYIQKFAIFLWLIGTSPKTAVRGFAVEIALPFMKQFGHVLEDYDLGNDLAPLLNAVKEELTEKEQVDENVAFNNEEEPMELDDVNGNGNIMTFNYHHRQAGRYEQRTQKKNRHNKLIRDNLVKEIGLYNVILVLLLRSCNDKSPVVRARALTQIAELLADANVRCKLSNIPKALVCADGDGDADTPENFLSGPLLLSIIATRSTDARVSTRRAAILALESLFPGLTELEQTGNLQIFKQCCRDPSLLVRKQAAESLSRLLLLLGANNNMLDNAWLSSVLPLINDREQSVVQLTSKLVLDTLIMPVLEKDTAPVAWRVLRAVEHEVNHRRLLLRCLLHQAKEGELKEHAVKILLRKCDDLENVDIIWMLLDFLSGVFKERARVAFSLITSFSISEFFFSIDASPAVRFWYTLNENDDSNLTGYVVEVLAHCADLISETDRNQLTQNIGTKLAKFSIGTSHITHVYYAFARLCKAVGDDAPGAKQLFEFNCILVDKCLKTLHNIIFRSIEATDETQLFREHDKMSQLLVRVISSLGEAIQYNPTLLSTNPKTFDIMQLIMASDVIQQQLTQTGTLTNTVQTGGPSIRPSTTHCAGVVSTIKHEPQQTCTSEDTSCGVVQNHACTAEAPKIVSQFGTKGSQEINAPTLGSQEPCASQPTSQGLGPTLFSQHAVNMDVLSPAVRAQAALAIGKLCLLDEKLAKKCIPVFSRQLLVNSNHLVRSNIVGVVCDLCKRYTLLVDRHSAIIASCLKDPSTLVRKQTLMLLTHLIKEQFVRWEGQIMYRFVSAILDENKEVREYAEMCLVDVLLVQFPSMFVNHFLECVFYFNSVTHGSWLAANNAMEEDLTERQELKCSLSGSRLRNARMTLYRFMIRTFNDENKFTIGMRIGQEVYAAIVDGVLDIRDRRVRALLEDCYEIMCCAEVKLSMALGKRSPNEVDDDDDEPPSNVQEAARKVVTQAFRKGIIDAVLPHIIQLKYFLQEKRLPELEFGIIRVLRELCKDHREQLDEFLASDKQLKAEIKFDLEKLEEKEKRINAANSNNSVAKMPANKDRRRVSFAVNTVRSPPRLNSSMRHQRNGAKENATTEQQTVEDREHAGENVTPAKSLLPPDAVPPEVGSTTERKEMKMTKTVEEMKGGDEYNNEDRGAHGLPSTNAQGTTIPISSTALDKRSSPKMQFEQLDEGSELAPRAFSTPAHNIDELTFGLGDEMSAIERTPTTRKRSKGRVRKPDVVPIEEVDNENE